MTRVVLLIFAALSIAYATFSVMRTHPRRIKSDPPAPPPVSSFLQTVAGVGLLEGNSENVAIGAHLPGVVAKVFVAAGQQVKEGDPLFEIDNRHLAAELVVREAALAAAAAKVETAVSSLADARDQLDRARALRTNKVISPDEFARRDFAVKTAAARLNESKAEATSATALQHATATDVERSTVRAPIDGEILQVKVRAGEYAPTGQIATPLLTLGRLRPLHLRVDVDEYEAWRVRPGASAVAQLRGNPDAKFALKFVRFEPLVVPKRSLTGASTERVDTRVLQIIYQVEQGTAPLFVGQQMDVFIDAAPKAGGPHEKESEPAFRTGPLRD